MIKDLTGLRFTRLLVLSFSHTAKRNSYWNVKCDCGIEKVVRSLSLTQGTTVSCGCYGRDARRARWTSHGQSKLPEYHVWQAMKARCCNPKNPRYHDYGGRGITVCEKWRAFEGFFEDMGFRPSKKHSLDRTDNNQGYFKENCSWVLPLQQMNNTSRNHIIEYQGKSLSVTQWARELGMNPMTLTARVFHYGWTVEEAFTTPVQKRTYNK